MTNEQDRSRLILTTASRFLSYRANMPETFDYFKANPTQAAELFRELDQAIFITNNNLRSGQFDPELRPYTQKLRSTSRKTLPYLTRPRTKSNCTALARALATQNLFMDYGETIVAGRQVPEYVTESGEYLTGHIRAQTHEARLVGMALHGWGIYMDLLPSSRGSKLHELAVDAVSEQIALDLKGSRVREVLVDKKRVHWNKPDFWFDPQANFSTKLLESLKQ